MTAPVTAARTGDDSGYWPLFRPVPFTNLAASGLLFGGAVLLGGWALKEATGAAPAEIAFLDGADTTGILTAPITLGAGQSRADLTPGWGVTMLGGLWITVVSGSVTGAAWVCDLAPGQV